MAHLKVVTITPLVPTSLPCQEKMLASVRLNLCERRVLLAASSRTWKRGVHENNTRATMASLFNLVS